MGFSRQEHWSGVPFLSPGDLSHPGIEPRRLVSCFAGRFFTDWATGESPVYRGELLIIPSISYLVIQIPAPISILLCVTQDYPLWAATLTCSFIHPMRSTGRHSEGRRVNFSGLFLWVPPWCTVHKPVVSFLRSRSSVRQVSPSCCLAGSTVPPSASSKTIVTPWGYWF